MVPRSDRRGIAALLVAVGGVLAGHWLTYRLVAPSGHARDTLLAGTGHGYLSYANDLALILALAAIAAIFLGRLCLHDGGELDLRTLAIRLIVFQTSAFAAMEGLERVTAGASPAGLLHHGLLPLGLGVQALVALAITLLIRWLLRMADAVATLLGVTGPRRREAVRVVPCPGDHVVVRSVARSAVGVRGPPSLPVIG